MRDLGTEVVKGRDDRKCLALATKGERDGRDQDQVQRSISGRRSIPHRKDDGRESESPFHLRGSEAAPVIEDTGNQGRKGANWQMKTIWPYPGPARMWIRSRLEFATSKVERWAMPTWCHMFNSTLIGAARVWFDELPPESIDGYKGLKAAFLAYSIQQKKYVKDLVEIHNIKQRDGETIEDFMGAFQRLKGAHEGGPECMRISGFMHGGNNPETNKASQTNHIKDKGEIEWQSSLPSYEEKSLPLLKRKVTYRGNHKTSPSSTSENMTFELKKQIEELVRAGKLSHLIKEVKQSRDQTKNGKKEARVKDKSLAINMIQQWQRVTKQKLTQSFARVGEIKFPPLANSDGTEGPLVIEAEIGRHMIHRMYIDGGSSTEVLYEHCFNQLRPEIKSQMVPATTSLTGFSRETIWPLGQLRLLVTIGDADHYTRAWMNFMIVRSMSPYNGIIGRSGIREIQAVPSTAHGMLKFPVDGGIVTIRSTILIPAECVTVITSPKEIPKEAVVRPENFKVAIHLNFTEQEVAIGETLSLKGRTELCTLLKENLDIFAWQLSDMTGVPRSVAEHRLNLREGYSPVRQKKRGQAPDSARAIQAEVQKLVGAGIMREVYYHDWLSNPIMVKKHDGSWRMCVDFTDLNKACPRDCYPLPEIDWKVESLCGYPFKCFLDAYKGYHQIQMAESDEEKTAFHTSQGVYCYTKMPFGLKNAGATYQRLVDKAFDNQVGRNIEVYVDDLVIKSYTEAEMLRDIEETFRTLRKINMKLNPKKCTFGAVEGMFLGYTITPEGIKPCPDKTEAVLQLPSPRTIKEVQSLNGKLASLNRFLSKSAEKSLPLFKTLKKCIKKSDFHWTPEAEQAFKQLKQHLAVSAVLMTERGTFKTPIYFISRALQGPELNYTPMEKLILSLVFAAKRLRRAVTEVEHHARRTQYHIPFEDVGERTDTGGLSQYEALIAGLRIAAQMGVRNLQVSVDSKLVVNQVLGTYVAKEENVIKYLEKVKSLVSSFDNFSISQVLQGKNKIADALSMIASTSFAYLSKQVLVEVLKEKSIQEKEVTTVVEEDGPTWMTPITDYLHDGTLPDDKKEARKLCIKARRYELLERVLYRRSFLKPWLRCVGPLQANYGIDIAGPFPEGPGKVKFLIVAMDYFTKWIEAKAVATITGNQVKKFVWDNIVCRFGLPGEIVSDNGKQFSDNPFKDWCDKLNITQRFASVKHPQSNGLVEELPHVLWAHRTMIKSSHGDTPFSLTYGTEAVIPAKIGMPTYCTATVDAVHNDEELRLNLDLLEEKRERAVICEAKAKRKMTKYYNARVRGVTFRPGDFVYRSNDASHDVAGGKLRPKWEGPYEVTDALGDGAYKLRSMDGAVLPRTWNIANLKKCYL
ncbi:reverse transcriptase domain-containing protein [Tanacetum coccineum]